MSELSRKWYVVRAAGGKEKKAKEYIENEIKRLNLSDYVTQVLIPTEKVYQVKNGKKVSAERIYLPGYILIEAALTGEIQHIIRNLPHVSGFLTGNVEKRVKVRNEKTGKEEEKVIKEKEPIPIRMSEVNKILGHVDELRDKDEENITPFIIGEPVKVIDGPFNGFDGSVEEISEDKKKLKVMVKIFGRKTLLELNFVQVVKE
jgi:transcriptional antiterminator NusG